MRTIRRASGMLFIVALFALHSFARAAVADAPEANVDPFLWLESVDSPRARAWVTTENAKTLAVLQSDPRFAAAYAAAVAAGESKDRIPTPDFTLGSVYNFWQDAEHSRGIWRHTTLADYAKPAPAWLTTLDLDALAKAEGKNWVWKGADCSAPGERRCLISLSDGGEDATTVREFDPVKAQFDPSGFVLPHGKQDVAWVGDDAVLDAREWSPGELTTSGYPFVVKRLERGRSLADAREIFRGSKSDVGVMPFVLRDGDGRRLTLIARDLSFFEHEYYVVAQNGTQKLALPLKASPVAMVRGRVLVRLGEAWHVNGATFGAGSLVALDLAALLATPTRLSPTLVYAPSDRETVDEVIATRDRALVSTLENVKGRAYVFTPESRGDGWTRQRLDLPDNSTIHPVDADLHGSSAFVSVTGFLTPTTLSLVDADRATVREVKALPAQFDASADTVEQHEAISNDGTRIPYFVVRPKSMPFDGTTPTIMYAYGGFEVSITPTYSATVGKLWLEHGGAYVVANIRGGGEFGPAWHEAGLTTHRQRIYDDFAAVARDLTARKITSPQHLGIRGGSNGGLLMGVEFTQHPELWHAVDIAVPLLDMLRFEQIAAGASWVGEYGTVTDPVQRAFLASISPYANLKAGVAYPEPFIWTTTKDDRVGPQHARKFAARLAALGDPYLFYEVIEGGHGAGANIKEQSFTSALEYTYFAQKLLPQK